VGVVAADICRNRSRNATKNTPLFCEPKAQKQTNMTLRQEETFSIVWSHNSFIGCPHNIIFCGPSEGGDGQEHGESPQLY
jgi:hypothetical protein